MVDDLTTPQMTFDLIAAMKEDPTCYEHEISKFFMRASPGCGLNATALQLFADKEHLPEEFMRAVKNFNIAQGVK